MRRWFRTFLLSTMAAFKTVALSCLVAAVSGFAPMARTMPSRAAISARATDASMDIERTVRRS